MTEVQAEALEVVQDHQVVPVEAPEIMDIRLWVDHFREECNQHGDTLLTMKTGK